MDRAGAETMVMNLYRAIDKAQYQFEFVYFTVKECSFDNEIESMGGIIHRIPEKYSNSPLVRTYQLYKLINKIGPFHAVHCHQLFSNAFHLIASTFAGVKKRIAHSHSTNYIDGKSIQGKIYQFFSKRIIDLLATDYIACGKEAGEFLFFSNNNVVFIPNAIDLGRFLLDDNKRSISFFNNDRIKSDTIILSQIGRFMPVKNCEFSIELASYLKKQKIDFHMFFVGSGHLEDDLKKIVVEENLFENITFLGIRKDIEVILKNTDVLLMPSIYEGFPVILVESQTVGTSALISSNISKEVDLGLGLIDFCSLESSNEIWFNQISSIMKRPKVSSDIRRKVIREKGFDIEVSVKLLEKVYN